MLMVVDTSAIIAVIAGEPERDSLLKATKGADLIAPESVHWEVGNAFSAMLRRKRISLAAARRALRAYEQIPIRFVHVELEESLELADTLGMYAYDAYLLRCALMHRAPIVTLDKDLVVNARKSKAGVVEVNG
jgi:predicted nucleic acid-binding protein